MSFNIWDVLIAFEDTEIINILLLPNHFGPNVGCTKTKNRKGQIYRLKVSKRSF